MRRHGLRATNRRVVAAKALVIGIHAARTKRQQQAYGEFMQKNAIVGIVVFEPGALREMHLRGLI